MVHYVNIENRGWSTLSQKIGWRKIVKDNSQGPNNVHIFNIQYSILFNIGQNNKRNLASSERNNSLDSLGRSGEIAAGGGGGQNSS